MADAIFRDGRTAYSFTDQAVSDIELQEIYELTRHAPTSMNTQPLRVVFVRTPEAKARLLACMPERNRPKSESAPVVAILAADPNFHEFLPKLLPMSPNAKDSFLDEKQRLEKAKFNATLQAGYFILAVRQVGLDAGPIGGFDREAIDKEFFSESGYRSIMLVNIGHVAEGGNFPRKPHVTFEEAVTLL